MFFLPICTKCDVDGNDSNLDLVRDTNVSLDMLVCLLVFACFGGLSSELSTHENHCEIK